MSGAKLDTYEPASLNCAGEFAPSPPNTFARLPCSSSCWPNVCASGRLLRREEDDVRVARRPASRATRSRSSAPRSTAGSPRRSGARSTVCAASARPTEYGSWKSMITTFFAFSLSTMKRASRRPLDEVARDDPEEAGRALARGALRQRRARRRRRDVRHAGGEVGLRSWPRPHPTSPGRSSRRRSGRRRTSAPAPERAPGPARRACRRSAAAPSGRARERAA